LINNVDFGVLEIKAKIKKPFQHRDRFENKPVPALKRLHNYALLLHIDEDVFLNP